MKHKVNRKGFSLIELMIVLAIVAILVALALPSYTRYVRKANRGEAQQLLLNWANNQEIWRANHQAYTDGSVQPDGTQLPIPTHTKFNFTITNVGAVTYTLTATAIGDQANDEERNESCGAMTINQANEKNHPFCW